MTVCTNAVPISGWWRWLRPCRRWRPGACCPSGVRRSPPTTVEDVAEFLHVDVDHRPGVGVFVASDVFPGDPVDVGQSLQVAAGEHRVHRRGRHPQPGGDVHRAQALLQPQVHDPPHHRLPGAGRGPVRAAGAVAHHRHPNLPRTARPATVSLSRTMTLRCSPAARRPGTSRVRPRRSSAPALSSGCLPPSGKPAASPPRVQTGRRGCHRCAQIDGQRKECAADEKSPVRRLRAARHATMTIRPVVTPSARRCSPRGTSPSPIRSLTNGTAAPRSTRAVSSSWHRLTRAASCRA